MSSTLLLSGEASPEAQLRNLWIYNNVRRCVKSSSACYVCVSCARSAVTGACRGARCSAGAAGTGPHAWHANPGLMQQCGVLLQQQPLLCADITESACMFGAAAGTTCSIFGADVCDWARRPNPTMQRLLQHASCNYITRRLPVYRAWMSR